MFRTKTPFDTGRRQLEGWGFVREEEEVEFLCLLSVIFVLTFVAITKEHMKDHIFELRRKI